MPDERTSTLKDILVLGRLHFVFGGFLLFSIGALIAYINGASWSPDQFVLGYAVFFCAHLSVSYSNDYFDAEGDKHTHPTTFSGGSKVLVNKPHLRRMSKILAISLIVISLSLSLVFIVVYSFPILFVIFVIVGNAFGWFYSAPPVSMARRGLGELSMMVTIGFLVPGFGYYAV